MIVPGDRHEVVLSVCLAAMNGTRFAGLLLTLGVEPDPRVWELCRGAATTGLPILMTPHNSYETATAVHDMNPEVPVDDAERARLVMGTVAEALDPGWLASLPTADHVPRMSPPAFRRRLVTQARAGRRPASCSPRAPSRARCAPPSPATSWASRGCVLLGPPDEVAAQAAGLGLTLPPDLEVVDPAAVAERYVDALVAARSRKGLARDAARDLLADPITVATMMLHLDEVEGMVAGAAHTTAATIRPPLQILGTGPGVSLVSSVFFMCLPDEVVLYGDCAINPDPDAEQLAEIALQSAESARTFGIEPRVAMISFSTGSSGSGEEVAKVSRGDRGRPAPRPGPARRRSAAVRRRGDRLGGSQQGTGQPGGRPGQRVRLPRPQHRQHDVQGGAAQRRGRQHRPDAPGPGQAGERPVARRLGGGHHLHDRHHRDPGRGRPAARAPPPPRGNRDRWTHDGPGRWTGARRGRCGRARRRRIGDSNP